MASAPSADHVELAAWNRELHFLIASAGSELIVKQLVPLRGMFHTRRTMWEKPRLITCFLADRDAIIGALASKDGQAASEATKAHILTELAERLANPDDYIRT